MRQLHQRTMEVNAMDEKQHDKKCLYDDSDEKGSSNLCCCLVMDEQGNFQDPCYSMMDECCLADASGHEHRRNI